MAADVRDTPTENRVGLARVLSDLGYIKKQFEKLCKSDKEQDEKFWRSEKEQNNRLTKLERALWALSGAGGVALVVLIQVASDVIKVKWFGLP